MNPAASPTVSAQGGSRVRATVEMAGRGTPNADLIAELNRVKVLFQLRTIANVRNRDNKLQPQTLFNLIAVDPLAIEGLLHHFGRRSVPIEAKCNTDPLVSMAGAVHKIAEAQSEGSPGGKAITDSECLTLEPFIDAAMASMEALKSRALDIRRERAK